MVDWDSDEFDGARKRREQEEFDARHASREDGLPWGHSAPCAPATTPACKPVTKAEALAAIDEVSRSVARTIDAKDALATSLARTDAARARLAEVITDREEQERAILDALEATREVLASEADYVSAARATLVALDALKALGEQHLVRQQWLAPL
jgi:hypothetical protein